MTTESGAELIEAGRRLFAGDWRFTYAAPSIETLPPMGATEIARAVGCKRGNVYKALKAAGLR